LSKPSVVLAVDLVQISAGRKDATNAERVQKGLLYGRRNRRIWANPSAAHQLLCTIGWRRLQLLNEAEVRLSAATGLLVLVEQAFCNIFVPYYRVVLAVEHFLFSM